MEWEGATLANCPQQLRYGDKTHALQACSESGRYELYHASGAGGDDDDLEFTSLINHRLIVQKAEEAAAGVDTALEQLKTSMAAMAEEKQANKYASPVFSGCPLSGCCRCILHPCPHTTRTGPCRLTCAAM